MKTPIQTLLPAAVALLAVALPQGASAQATLEKIKSRGQINVGYRVLAAPFSLNEAPGKPVGYSIEFCKPIIEQLRQAAGNKNLPAAWRRLSIMGLQKSML